MCLCPCPPHWARGVHREGGRSPPGEPRSPPREPSQALFYCIFPSWPYPTCCAYFSDYLVSLRLMTYSGGSWEKSTGLELTGTWSPRVPPPTCLESGGVTPGRPCPAMWGTAVPVSALPPGSSELGSGSSALSMLGVTQWPPGPEVESCSCLSKCVGWSSCLGPPLGPWAVTPEGHCREEKCLFPGTLPRSRAGLLLPKADYREASTAVRLTAALHEAGVHA